MIAVDTHLSSERVLAVLEELAGRRGLPAALACDNGPEFTGCAFDAWAYQRGNKSQFIRPGKPLENAFIESFTDGCATSACPRAGPSTSPMPARRLRHGGATTTALAPTAGSPDAHPAGLSTSSRSELRVHPTRNPCSSNGGDLTRGQLDVMLRAVLDSCRTAACHRGRHAMGVIPATEHSTGASAVSRGISTLSHASVAAARAASMDDTMSRSRSQHSRSAMLTAGSVTLTGQCHVATHTRSAERLTPRGCQFGAFCDVCTL